MDLFAVILLAVALGGLALKERQRREARLVQRRVLTRVRMSAFEDVTALGEALVEVDEDMKSAGQELDEAVNVAYQRALDFYDMAKRAADEMTDPADARKLEEVVEDGRHAISCVLARAAGDPLPTRRRLCFFDPRHGPSVTDVPFVPSGGVERHVPACMLDAQRILDPAEHGKRDVLAAGRRMASWDGGRTYHPHAMGYFEKELLAWLLPGAWSWVAISLGHESGVDREYKTEG